MPPNTILLSAMMRELSARPGFTETLLREVQGAHPGAGRHGPALLTPALANDLRDRVLGKDWAGLDRFPGWTMRAINPAVDVVEHVAGKDQKLEALSAVHPGAPADAAARQWLDVGPFPLARGGQISLNEASTLPGFTTQGIVTDLGAGVTRGDGPNPQLEPEHAESQRLADVLNRMAMNGEAGVQPFTVKRSWDTVLALRSQSLARGPAADKPKLFAGSPEELVGDLLASGHTVTVTDSRYFANFGHLHFRGQDVMMPFWVNTGMRVPGSGGLFRRDRPLLVPVSHAELEWHVRGPHVNADVSWYFGVDGKAEWRVMDTLDQSWVGHRDAHVYTGAQAIAATRLASAFTVAYMHLHAAHPQLPFGGYYTLGVCQDAVAAIERTLTGAVTLFPNTANDALFSDARDAEVNALLRAIPKDRGGRAPEPARVFGSLPYAPAKDAAHAFDAVTVPGLASDLNGAYADARNGSLRPGHMRLIVAAAVAIGLGLTLLARLLSRRRHV